MHWVGRLQKALHEDRFTLFSQPIKPLLNGADHRRYQEVLLRMVDEAGNIVPPMEFIPAAERYNLMPAIDRWVIRKALAAFAPQRGGAPGDDILFINLSGASLADEQMLNFIHEQLRAHGLPPESVCFEITETAAVANLDTAVTFMQALKKAGCRFALDDFGCGMSSFAYLRNLPVDYLKIYGANNATDRAMVSAINHVGHTMDIQTIAEWVESEKVLEELKMTGVDFAQGYCIARPQPWLNA